MNSDRFLRIFEVLDVLVTHPDGMRLTEISQELDAPVSSCHNLLQTMVAAEVVSLGNDLRYLVGPRAVRLGIRIVNSLEVRTVGRRLLDKLARAINNDVYVAIRVGDRVVYVDRFLGTQPVTVNIRLGESLALHATAVGKLYAAYQRDLEKLIMTRTRKKLASNTIVDADLLREEFEDIRAQRVSISREEAFEGVVGIAVPVHDASGGLAAAIHVSILAAGLGEERLRTIIDEARATAELIESELGFNGGRARAVGES